MGLGPGGSVVERGCADVALGAHARLVAGLTAVTVPTCCPTVGSHSPKPGVVFRATSLVARFAGVVVVASSTILPMLLKHSPTRLFAMAHLPQSSVVRGTNLLGILAVAGLAVRF